MIETDDWRLKGQEECLADKTMTFSVWKALNAEHDHDHCEFCWAKFADLPDALKEGYTTEDRRRWVCPTCFQDFQELFHWELISAKKGKCCL